MSLGVGSLPPPATSRNSEALTDLSGPLRQTTMDDDGFGWFWNPSRPICL